MPEKLCIFATVSIFTPYLRQKERFLFHGLSYMYLGTTPLPEANQREGNDAERKFQGTSQLL